MPWPRVVPVVSQDTFVQFTFSIQIVKRSASSIQGIHFSMRSTFLQFVPTQAHGLLSANICTRLLSQLCQHLEQKRYSSWRLQNATSTHDSQHMPLHTVAVWTKSALLHRSVCFDAVRAS